MEEVAVLQEPVLPEIAPIVERLQIQLVHLAVAGERHAARPRVRTEPARAGDGVLHPQRHVGDGERGGLGDLARHLDALPAEGGDAHVETLSVPIQVVDRELTADELVRTVADEVSRFTAGADQADDITLVALKVLPVLE